MRELGAAHDALATGCRDEEVVTARAFGAVRLVPRRRRGCRRDSESSRGTRDARCCRDSFASRRSCLERSSAGRSRDRSPRGSRPRPAWWRSRRRARRDSRLRSPPGHPRCRPRESRTSSRRPRPARASRRATRAAAASPRAQRRPSPSASSIGATLDCGSPCSPSCGGRRRAAAPRSARPSERNTVFVPVSRLETRNHGISCSVSSVATNSIVRVSETCE